MSDNAFEILLIEDNPGDARLVEELLAETADRSESTGGSDDGRPNVRHADRLADGLGRLDTEPVDVVLLDLGLPDSTGLETLETVRGHSRGIPIVVLTGLDDETVGDRAVQRGAQEYLVKDELTPPLLRRSLRHAIDRKRFDRTRTALHRASRELIQAESKADVSQLAVDTAVEVLDLSGVGIYLLDDSANVLRPTAYTDYIEGIFGEPPSFGPGDTSITWQAFIRGETIALDDVLESEHVHREDTPLRSGVWIPLGDHGVLAVVSETKGGIDRQMHQLADHLAATVEATLDRVEREEALREQERELAERNRQLEELNRVNELIREIDHGLVQARTRTAIEQAVCDLLTTEGRFAFAWIGESTGEGTVEPRTWRGDDRGYLDAVPLAIDADGAPPAATTLATGTVTLAPNVAADLRSGSWRKAAFARDLQSAISVPLTYDGITYGVLTVFATDPEAFDERLTGVFEELGETIANAINAVETRRTLLSDTVVELDLLIRASDHLLVRLAREADCRIDYDGTVPQSDGTVRLFFGASGCPASAIRGIVDDTPTVRGSDLINEADDADEYRFEVTVSGPTIPSTVIECGGVARSIRVADDGVRVVVELPDTTDVRTFVDRLEGTYPDTELIARRDRDRSERTHRSASEALDERLTDRQLQALRTAYLSGYFERPRERTGEEVAESLGITQSTFNAHLREAERKLCALLFDG